MKPTAILTADIHLREDTPRNRTDNYFAAQAKKIQFINDLQKHFEIPILDAGDLLHKWNSSPYLEAWALKNLPEDMITIPGTHELPSHNINNLEKSSLNVLYVANKIHIKNDDIEPDRNEYCRACLWQNKVPYTLLGFHWGYSLDYINTITNMIERQEKELFVCIIHRMVIDEELKYEDNTALTGHVLLRKLKDFDLIVSGHNHKPFVIKHKNQLLVNPGSMMRMTKSQIDHKPRVYLWYAETNEVEPVFLPIEKDVFAIKRIEEEEHRNEYLESYILALNDKYEVTLSFKKNLENYFEKNKTRKPVKDIVWNNVP